jgi:hypothetical protein
VSGESGGSAGGAAATGGGRSGGNGAAGGDGGVAPINDASTDRWIGTSVKPSPPGASPGAADGASGGLTAGALSSYDNGSGTAVGGTPLSGAPNPIRGRPLLGEATGVAGLAGGASGVSAARWTAWGVPTSAAAGGAVGSAPNGGRSPTPGSASGAGGSAAALTSTGSSTGGSAGSGGGSSTTFRCTSGMPAVGAVVSGLDVGGGSAAPAEATDRWIAVGRGGGSSVSSGARAEEMDGRPRPPPSPSTTPVGAESTTAWLSDPVKTGDRQLESSLANVAGRETGAIGVSRLRWIGGRNAQPIGLGAGAAGAGVGGVGDGAGSTDRRDHGQRTARLTSLQRGGC